MKKITNKLLLIKKDYYQEVMKSKAIQKLYQEALKFASAKHAEKDQKVPGTNLPYAVHISTVAMEILIAGYHTPDFNLGFAIQVSLLHDTLEDTQTSFMEIEENFGREVAEGVLALSKNAQLPREDQMADSLNRIKAQPYEVWAVKLADRITNLQPPPTHWNETKKLNYLTEAMLILKELRNGNEYLATRLQLQIDEYRNYLGFKLSD